MKDRNENKPGYKKTKVGWIPEEWECKELRRVVSQPLMNGIFKRPNADKPQPNRVYNAGAIGL